MRNLALWFVCLKHFQTSRAPEAALALGVTEVPAAGTRSPGGLRRPTRGRPRAGAQTWPLVAPSKKPKCRRRVTSVAAASPALLRPSGSKDRTEPRHGMGPHSRAGVAPRAAPKVTPGTAPSVAPGTAPSTAAPWPDQCQGCSAPRPCVSRDLLWGHQPGSAVPCSVPQFPSPQRLSGEHRALMGCLEGPSTPNTFGIPVLELSAGEQ